MVSYLHCPNGHKSEGSGACKTCGYHPSTGLSLAEMMVNAVTPPEMQKAITANRSEERVS